MSLLVIIIILVAGFLLFLLASHKNKRGPGWVQFFAKGKDAGFSLSEIELLHQLAIKLKLDEPTTLFFSQEKLDECIRALVKDMHNSGTEADSEDHHFLSKLYDYRKKIEMEKPKVKHGIKNSRHISEGQNLRILIIGMGVFKSQVIKNFSKEIIVSRPESDRLPVDFSWLEQQISVYFWRDGDAGYVFDTVVLDDCFTNGIPSLKIAHSDSLFRTQKRKSIRVRMHKPAFLYPVTNEEEAGAIEVNPGVKSFLEDLSDTGCAVSVGGKAFADMRLKVQFALNNDVICMSGTVRSVQYKADSNKSLVHIESDPLPIEKRNRILGEVFGMLPEDEDDLPFRMLGEEAEELMLESDEDKDVLDLIEVGSQEDGSTDADAGF